MEVEQRSMGPHNVELYCKFVLYNVKIHNLYFHNIGFYPHNADGMYGTAKKKRPCYLVGNLVATNWPIEKALHAIGYNQIPTK